MATKAMIDGTLSLVIVEAENLKKKDLINKMDPYCVVEFNDETFKTEPHKKGHKNPTWEESLKIPMRGKNLSEKIVFSVYDKELIHDNKIGRAEFTLQKLADLGQKEDLCTIELETFGVIDKHKPAGTLKIRINFTGDGWPGSVKESDKPKAVAMPKKDDKVFKEHKNLEHFSDVDGKEKRLDTNVTKHQDDRIPQDIEPVHKEKKDINRYDDGLNKDKHHHKDKHHLTGEKAHHKYDDGLTKDKHHLTGDKDYHKNDDGLHKDKHHLTGDKASHQYDAGLNKDKHHLTGDKDYHNKYDDGLAKDKAYDCNKKNINDFQDKPATSLVNPNDMIPHDRREKSPFQKDKVTLENDTSSVTPQTDTNKEFHSSDTNKTSFGQQDLHTNKDKMFQDNNNKLNNENSLDKGRAHELHSQNPDLAYHNKDV